MHLGSGIYSRLQLSHCIILANVAMDHTRFRNLLVKPRLTKSVNSTVDPSER